MKIGIGGIYHETHTFPREKTSFGDFERSMFRFTEIIDNFKKTSTSIGGYLDYSLRKKIDIFPTFYSAATPSGMVAKQAFKKLLSMFNATLSGIDDIDGFLLAQHGAMCVEGYNDAEAHLIKMIRKTIGRKPLVVTTDYHANISDEMVASCDCIVGYDTYPHIDIFERGYDAFGIVDEMVSKKTIAKNAFISLPLLGVPQVITTESGIMKDAIDMANEYEKYKYIKNITIAGGFVYSDVKSAGVSIIVSFEDGTQEDKATNIAADIGRYIWNSREKMSVNNTNVKDAVRQAKNSYDFPVILVDVADNIGAGTPGDGTVLLEELLKNKMTGSIVCICDKDAVEKCIKTGIANNINLIVGGKSKDFYGKPVELKGYIKLISDGEFINTGKNMTGLKTKMGKSVLLLSDGIKILLTEFPTPPNDPNMLLSMGIELKEEKFLVVKGAIAWKTGIDIKPAKVIYVDTPGPTSSNLNNFHYENIRRPIYPLDELEIDIKKSVTIYG